MYYGPEFNDPASDRSFQLWMSQNGYHTDLDLMGERGSMGAIGPEWASAAAVPGSLFKMYASEGGTRVPLIIRAPGMTQQGFNPALNFVTDVAPTLAELAGLSPTDMDGRSIVPLLTGTATDIYGDEDPVGLEVAGNSALFKGRFKLTKNSLPHGDARWRLHDLNHDPAEIRDLSAERPGLREQLLADYQRYADEVGVIPLPKDFDIQAQISVNVQRTMLSRSIPALVAAGSLIIVLILVAVLLYRRRKNQASGRA